MRQEQASIATRGAHDPMGVVKEKRAVPVAGERKRENPENMDNAVQSAP